jgi:uncharacterized protein (TIRG00374 family)
MNKNIKFIIEIIICIGIIAYLISKLDLPKLIEILKSVDYIWIIFTAVIFLFYIIANAYSLKILFDSKKRIPMLEWLKIYFIGMSLGLVLPGRAGDLSIIYFTKEKGFEYGESTAFTLTDKLITLIVYLIIASIGVFTILKSSELYIGLIIALLLILGGLFCITPFGRRIITKIIGKYSEKFRGFYNTFKFLAKSHKDKIFVNLLITLTRPVTNGIIMTLVLYSMNIQVPFFYLILINAMGLIVSLIPITPNGIGVREGIGAYMFSLIGVSLENSLSMYLILIAINYSFGIIGATYYLTTKKRTE